MSASVPAENRVVLPTPEGRLPVIVLTPARDRPKAAVIVYMDAFGMRPELVDMGRRYAEAGYVVFLPDLYHRLGANVRFDIPGSADAPLDPAMGTANAATTLDHSIRDTGAILAHADAAMALGGMRFMTVGYCMGARHALAAAVAHPDRIVASACVHGGRLVTDGPDSPHRLIPRVSGTIYFAFAANDDTCPDAHKALIEETIKGCGIKGSTEHFAAHHGWTFPSRWCYDEAAAERLLTRVFSFFDAANA